MAKKDTDFFICPHNDVNAILEIGYSNLTETIKAAKDILKNDVDCHSYDIWQKVATIEIVVPKEPPPQFTVIRHNK